MALEFRYLTIEIIIERCHSSVSCSHGTGLRYTPKFENYQFYLVGEDSFPDDTDYFDGGLASELFLHLSNKEIHDILDAANYYLKPGGKFISTIYPSAGPGGTTDELDWKFRMLGLEAGMKFYETIKDESGAKVIDIKTIAQRLKENNPKAYKDNKTKYWLDLEQVRAFPEGDLERLFRYCGFRIKEKQPIKGGMFSFAHRLVYFLKK